MQVLADVLNKLYVEDVARARCGGQTENGLAHTHRGTVAVAVDGHLANGGGSHLRTFVRAVEPPEVAGAGSGTQIGAANDEILLRPGNSIVKIGVVQHQCHVVGARSGVDVDDVQLRVVADVLGTDTPRVACGPLVADELVAVGVLLVAAHQTHVVEAGNER